MIGVFGDSHADPECGNAAKQSLMSESWIYHLGETAVPHGRSGTSLLWSYRKFLENHEKYDRIIFVMTNADRFDHAGDKKDWSGKKNVTNFGHAEFILKEGFWVKQLISQSQPDLQYDWDIPRVKACRDYAMHVNDSIASNLQAQLIKEGILSRRPDTILIPMGEHHNRKTWTYIPPGSWCIHYQNLQIRSLFPNQPHLYVELGNNVQEINVANHFTKEINQLFAGHVRQALTGEGWQDWDIDKIASIPHSEPWDYYYEPLLK